MGEEMRRFTNDWLIDPFFTSIFLSNGRFTQHWYHTLSSFYQHPRCGWAGQSNARYSFLWYPIQSAQKLFWILGKQSQTSSSSLSSSSSSSLSLISSHPIYQHIFQGIYQGILPTRSLSGWEIWGCAGNTALLGGWFACCWCGCWMEEESTPRKGFEAIEGDSVFQIWSAGWVMMRLNFRTKKKDHQPSQAFIHFQRITGIERKGFCCDGNHHLRLPSYIDKECYPHLH